MGDVPSIAQRPSNHCYRPDGRDMAYAAFIKILHLVVGMIFSGNAIVPSF
jgi:hypothetical protein